MRSPQRTQVGNIANTSRASVSSAGLLAGNDTRGAGAEGGRNRAGEITRMRDDRESPQKPANETDRAWRRQRGWREEGDGGNQRYDEEDYRGGVGRDAERGTQRED